MSEPQTITRLAAKGDGATADGQHVSGTVPGDMVQSGSLVAKGPHHVEPICQHFSKCGGCQLQQADEEVLSDFVHDRVVNAAQGQGIEPGEVLPVHLSQAHSRRRATFHAMPTQRGAVLGYREGGSHRIVDLKECPVLAEPLVGMVGPLREFVASYGSKGAIDVTVALCDQGLDIGFKNLALEGLEATEAALDFAREHQLARVAIDQGYGFETVWEPEPATVTLNGSVVPFPIGAFQQATLDAETRLIADAKRWIGEGRLIADLFAGLGTFAFAMAAGRKVLAVEADRAAHLACKTGAARSGGRVTALHRDLFRNPLDSTELDHFAAVLLDPPRAGAREQAARIAESNLARVVYVSCNPSSWARDAAQLVGAGFALEKLRPVGQFRWSTHVELISLFTR
jgi:23S rRNA (uracil1939-C5)-methyltransferase